jgi:hypothetical protein
VGIIKTALFLGQLQLPKRGVFLKISRGLDTLKMWDVYLNLSLLIKLDTRRGLKRFL